MAAFCSKVDKVDDNLETWRDEGWILPQNLVQMNFIPMMISRRGSSHTMKAHGFVTCHSIFTVLRIQRDHPPAGL